MAHIGLSDIESALKKSGLPLGGPADAMRTASPLAPYALDATTPQAPAPDFGYKQKLDQIASMDKKLAGLYGDPNSGMYIENPMQRQNALSGASNQEYRQAGDIAQREQKTQEQQDKQREQLMKESEQYYNALIQIQTREEKALKKAGSKGGSRKTTAIEEMAGFTDPEAAKLWSTTLTADQKRRWLQMVLEGNIDPTTAPGVPVPTEVPEGGFSTKNVLDFYDAEKAVALEKKKAAESQKAVKAQEKEKKKSSTANVLQDLMNKL